MYTCIHEYILIYICMYVCMHVCAAMCICTICTIYLVCYKGKCFSNIFSSHQFRLTHCITK